MKIVQTFWSGGRSPLEHSYGWPHAEYNLMSWTLSCLSLRKHYDRGALHGPAWHEALTVKVAPAQHTSTCHQRG